MNFQKFSGIRNLLRKTGIISIIRYPEKRKDKKRQAYYNNHKPKQAKFSLDGVDLVVNVADAYEWGRVHSFEDDEKILLAMSKQFKEGECFWDVGTSIGLYSIYMAKYLKNTGQVISFEPENRSKKRLTENITSNNISNIEIIMLGLGKEKGSFQLALAETASAGNHKILMASESTNTNTQKIEVVTGDSLVATKKVPTPNVIKIDVEGQEEAVLLGCSDILKQKKCHTVIIEVHFSIFNARNDDGAVDRMVKHLKESGFTTISWIDPSHLAAYK